MRAATARAFPGGVGGARSGAPRTAVRGALAKGRDKEEREKHPRGRAGPAVRGDQYGRMDELKRRRAAAPLSSR